MTERTTTSLSLMKHYLSLQAKVSWQMLRHPGRRSQRQQLEVLDRFVVIESKQVWAVRAIRIGAIDNFSCKTWPECKGTTVTYSDPPLAVAAARIPRRLLGL